MLKPRRTGTAFTVIPNPHKRTPERRALADAVFERDRRAVLVEAKRAEIAATEKARTAIYSRQAEAEEHAARFKGMLRESDRRDALLRGETPPAMDGAAEAKAAVAALDAELMKS